MENIYLNKIIDAYKNIDFLNRFEKVLVHTNFENRLTKIDKNEILSILKAIGYSFKVKSPGKDFYIEDEEGDLKFVFSFNVNGGIVLSYIYLYYKGVKIPYENSNLVFTYKYLKGDMEMLMEPSTIFADYKEFNEIITPILCIYEDFKKEFCLLVK